MNCIYINPSELDGHKISCEYVIQRKKLQKILETYKTIGLNNIAKEITSGIRIKKEFYCEGGLQIIAPGDVRNGTVYINELKSINKEIVKDKDIVIEGDILITAAGKSGQIVYVSEELEGCIITSDIIKIRLNDSAKSLALVVFFKSEVGQNILDNLKNGLIKKIALEDIQGLMIPKNYDENYVNAKDTLAKQSQIIKLYKEAENGFYKYLDYSGEDEKKQCFLVYNHLDTNRLDPEYYSNFFTEFYETINTDTKYVKWQRLGEVVQIKAAVKPEIDENKKVKYFSLSDVDEKLSVIKEVHEEEYGKLSNRMRYVVNEGEIVTAKGGSATGTKSHATALITKELDGMVTSDAFFNIVPMNIDRYYLLFLFKQLVVISQINMISKGTTYKLVQRQDLENIKIPRLSQMNESLISNKIKLIYR
ncbi:restriction endonuclease subunit S [Clostridium sporogenes]|uniref:restriction endonuclease subunit S n=1 Tax=Clostridium sporogenes TaxID=1509 RepID=UPI002237114D|nr:restriction endonuclease subunit S [Clostridium sporogenes]MCW6078098.1 restriction endonuclease subunit S [Clostridium sporogenes]